MESPHATLSESPFGVVKPSSFFTKPIRVAPLNIATKHQHQQHQQPSLTTSVKMMSPTSFASRPPLSIQTPRPLLSSQTFLEANVRLLCDMVDSILRTNESDQKMLRIEVSQQPHSGLPNTLEPSCNDPKSPLYILSPKSFTQAKSDISKLDDSVVSKLNSDTLLDLFPTPPPLPAAASQSPSSEPTNNNTISITSAIPHLTIPILDRPTTIVVSPTTSWSCPSEDSWECRPRKGSKQHRNWVISSGLFVSTSETAAASEAGTEEGEKGENNYTHLKGALIYGSEKMTETEASGGGCYLAAPPPPGILSPAPPMTTTTALSSPAAAAAALPRPLVARRSLRQEKNHSSFSSTVGSSLPAPLMTANLGVTSHSMDRLPISSSFNSNNNNLDTPCSVSTTMSPFSSMDALSQSLLNIETQMRRPSFLMNRRTSILSTLFATNSFVLDQYDRSEQPSPFLSTDSLTVESAEIESSPLFLGVPKERHESDGAGPLDTPHCESESVQAMDWRAWHGSWIRRRIKPEDDSSVLSPTSPAPRTSYSSIRSSSVLSPTSPAPRSSYSSTRSSSSTSTTTCSSPNMTLRPATTLVKRLSQRLRRPRMLSPTSPTSTLSSSASSPLAAFASSPMSTFYSPFALPNTPTTPTKDANPELWENEGQKWGDRFQSLINNFQPNSTSSSSLPSLPPTSSSSSSPNGKSSKKRWADILPKSRWNKWSSSRTSSSSSSSSRSSSDSERV